MSELWPALIDALGPELWVVLVCAAFALATALGVIGIARLATQVPVEDRQFKDRPPLLWRSGWPLVLLLAEPVALAMPARVRKRLSASLQSAALDYALTPEQFVAGCLLAAAAAVIAAAAGIALAAAPAGTAVAVGSAALAGAALPCAWLRRRVERRTASIARQLPFFLDAITLAVEAGANLTGAIAQAVDRGPAGALRGELMRVLRDVRAGRTRADALRSLADRLQLPAIASLVSALIAAERHGTGLGTALRAQADQRRSERFARAERLAMQAPVKMLLPLLVFVFPCTFVLLAFPVVVRLLEEGLLR